MEAGKPEIVVLVAGRETLPVIAEVAQWPEGGWEVRMRMRGHAPAVAHGATREAAICAAMGFR